MTPPTMTSRQALLAVLLAGTVALGLGGCGRRGRPEPPPNPDAPARVQPEGKSRSGRAQPTFQTRPGTVAQTDDDDEEDEPDATVAASPLPTPPGRKKAQPFLVPKEPFILDSIL